MNMSIAIFPIILVLFFFGMLMAGFVSVLVFTRCHAGKVIAAGSMIVPLGVIAMLCLYFLRSDSSTAIISEESSPVPLIGIDSPPVPVVTEQAVLPEPTAIAVQVESAPAPATNAAPAQPAAPIQAHTAGPKRPAWMDQPTGYRDGVDRTIATAGPYSTPQECYQKLNDAIREALRNHVGRFMTLPAGVEIELPPDFIHKQIVRDEWLQQSEYSIGPMYNLHALLVFDSSVNQEIDRRYRESHRAGRLAYTGAGAALLLGLIGTMFGYLKLDTLTRGYYTGRLRAAATAAILALATVAGLLAHGDIGF